MRLAQMTANQWSAVAAWAVVAIGLFGGIVALRQLRETRRLRFEQIQPYVVAFIEPSAGGSWFVDLVVKNFGQTAATNVTLSIDPTPQRAEGKEPSEIALPTTIPLLVPGQEWRTLWDTGMARHDSGLPDRHDATVTFLDSQGKVPFTFHFILDWEPMRSQEIVTIYGPHDSAKALREMKKIVERWGESNISGGLSVVVRNGEKRDQEVQEERNRRTEESSNGATNDEAEDD